MSDTARRRKRGLDAVARQQDAAIESARTRLAAARGVVAELDAEIETCARGIVEDESGLRAALGDGTAMAHGTTVLWAAHLSRQRSFLAARRRDRKQASTRADEAADALEALVRSRRATGRLSERVRAERRSELRRLEERDADEQWLLRGGPSQ